MVCDVECLLLGVFIAVSSPRGSDIYSFEADRVLDVRHYLAAMGQPPRQCFRHFKLSELKCFAGQAFAGPCVATIVMALALNPWAPWWPQPDGS